jgi:hypothetical protein
MTFRRLPCSAVLLCLGSCWMYRAPPVVCADAGGIVAVTACPMLFAVVAEKCAASSNCPDAGCWTEPIQISDAGNSDSGVTTNWTCEDFFMRAECGNPIADPEPICFPALDACLEILSDANSCADAVQVNCGARICPYQQAAD